MSDNYRGYDDRPDDWYSTEYNSFSGASRRKRGCRVFLTVTVAIIACSLLVFAGIGLYAIYTEPGNEGFIPRPDQILPWEEDFETPIPAPDIEKEEPQGNPDGPELIITPLTEDAQALTIPEISTAVSPSVVGILSEGDYATSTGSGIVMSSDGYVITNAHVVEGGLYVTVFMADGTSYEANIVGSDSKTDLAVLKIEGNNFLPAAFGSSSDLEVGELAVAIGNPLGMELFGSVTAGIISAVDREISFEDQLMTLIQTDAAINPGNSGGALVNEYGQVIGINSAKIVSGNPFETNTVEGLGFAIPIESAKPIIDSLIKLGYVPGRPVIGIVGEDVSDYYSEHFDRPLGVYIHSVTEGTDAVDKGLEAGDIVIAVNGITVTNMEELNEVKNQFTTGDTITLTIDREGVVFDVDIELTEEK